MCVNLQYMICGSRLDPSLLGVCLEICFCFANVVAASSPILASMQKPIPLIVISSFCIVGITTVRSFHLIREESLDIAHTILSIVESSFKDYHSESNRPADQRD
mmetsp:Transcript_12808/g.21677  ORF Transcript_12808/g.21677 Transcript_12808/m.21677 type:complete len:104 (-) Transcript_12808:235-546(-)